MNKSIKPIRCSFGQFGICIRQQLQISVTSNFLLHSCSLAKKGGGRGRGVVLCSTINLQQQNKQKHQTTPLKENFILRENKNRVNEIDTKSETASLCTVSESDQEGQGCLY